MGSRGNRQFTEDWSEGSGDWRQGSRSQGCDQRRLPAAFGGLGNGFRGLRPVDGVQKSVTRGFAAVCAGIHVGDRSLAPVFRRQAATLANPNFSRATTKFSRATTRFSLATLGSRLR